jgi:hypothetical protein
MYFGYNDIQKNAHIYFNIDDGDWKTNISDFIDKYIHYVMFIKQKYKIIPILSCIYPNPRENAKGVNYNGSNDERVEYTKHANKILAELCKTNGLLFLDIYDFIADEYGYIKCEYTADFIHLDYNNSFIKEYIETEIYKLITPPL